MPIGLFFLCAGGETWWLYPSAHGFDVTTLILCRGKWQEPINALPTHQEAKKLTDQRYVPASWSRSVCVHVSVHYPTHKPDGYILIIVIIGNAKLVINLQSCTLLSFLPLGTSAERVMSLPPSVRLSVRLSVRPLLACLRDNSSSI